MLKLDCVTKSFAQKKHVVYDVSVEVRPFSIMGVLGRNGAGKSTLLRMMSGAILPDSGRVLFFGEPLSYLHRRQNIGYMPEVPVMFKRSTVFEMLTYIAYLRGLRRPYIQPRVQLLLDRFHLHGIASQCIAQLSRGTLQKVQFIATILHQPTLAVLDEPFNGLDIHSISLMKDIITELTQIGSAFVISTHQFEHAESLFHSVFFIEGGKEVLSGRVSDLLLTFQSFYEWHIEFVPSNHAAAIFQSMLDKQWIEWVSVKPFSNGNSHSQATFKLRPHCEPSHIISFINEHISIRKLEMVTPTLNDIFNSVQGGKGNPS